MKKYLIILIALFFSATILAQTNFTKGFNEGYKKGFCQDQGVGCIKPIPPISPNPKIGENSNNYTDGYNRGFQSGLNAQKSNNNENNYKTAKAKFVDGVINQSSTKKRIDVLKNLDKKQEFNLLYSKSLKSRIRIIKKSTKDHLILDGINEISESISFYEKPSNVNLAESAFIKMDNYLSEIEKLALEKKSNSVKIYYSKAKTELRKGPSENYEKLINETASKHFKKTVNISINYYNQIKVISEENGWSKISVTEPDYMSDIVGWIKTDYILQ